MMISDMIICKSTKMASRKIASSCLQARTQLSGTPARIIQSHVHVFISNYRAHNRIFVESDRIFIRAATKDKSKGIAGTFTFKFWTSGLKIL